MPAKEGEKKVRAERLGPFLFLYFISDFTSYIKIPQSKIKMDLLRFCKAPKVSSDFYF
jgi:hypothetical protein